MDQATAGTARKVALRERTYFAQLRALAARGPQAEELLARVLQRLNDLEQPSTRDGEQQPSF